MAKVYELLFGSHHVINVTEFCMDPYYIDNLVVENALTEESEVFQATLNGLSNHRIEGVFVMQNDYEDSFLIATKIYMPWMNSTGEYRFKCYFGIFSFDSSGEYYIEMCEFF